MRSVDLSRSARKKSWACSRRWKRGPGATTNPNTRSGRHGSTLFRSAGRRLAGGRPRWGEVRHQVSKRVTQVDGVTAEVKEPEPGQLSNRSPRLVVHWDGARLGIT